MFTLCLKYSSLKINRKIRVVDRMTVRQRTRSRLRGAGDSAAN